MRKTLITLLVVMTMTLTASAVSLGAGPSTIEYKNLLPGGYSESQITVSTSGSDDLACQIEATGDIQDWISLDIGDKFQLPAKSRKDIKVIIEPPKDTEPGTYSGSVYIKAGPISESDSGTGMAVGAGVRIKVTAHITDEEIKSYSLKSSSVSNTEVGYPIKFQTTLKNTGNTRLSPEISIEVYDQSGNIVKTYKQTIAEIQPSIESTAELDLPSDELPVGRYTAKIKVGQEEQTLTFSLLNEGTLALQGILKSVSLNKIWVSTGENVKITGEVENTGEIMIQGAKLDLEIYLMDEKYQTEKLISVIAGKDVLDIPVGQTVSLDAYYTTTEPGRYLIYGTVSYAGKKSMQKSTVLNVFQEPTNYTPYILIAAAAAIVIVFLLMRKSEDGRTRKFKKIWGNYLQIK